MKQWINKPMSEFFVSIGQWFNESMNQWPNDSMNEWMRESLSQWTNDSERTNESLTRWVDETTKQRIKESLNQWKWIWEWTHHRINEPINQYEPMKHNESSANAFFYSRLQTRIAERCTKSTKVRAASMLQRGLDHTNLELVSWNQALAKVWCTSSKSATRRLRETFLLSKTER